MNEDLSNLFEKFNINKDNISPEMIDSIMGMVNNNSVSNSSGNTSNKESETSNANIDFDTFIKMKSIMDKMNTKDNPRSKLLLSLKPYLKEDRKNKLDQYIQLSKLMEILPFLGGDLKNDTK